MQPENQDGIYLNGTIYMMLFYAFGPIMQRHLQTEQRQSSCKWAIHDLINISHPCQTLKNSRNSIIVMRQKKTVVWLPTWQTLSSVGAFNHEISLLTQQYNVVIKLHPLMASHEPERVDELKRYKYTHLITDSSDNFPLYQLAYFMLFDYGGPPLAAIYTDKNLILLNVPNANTDKLTGIHSPDVAIREHMINVNAEDHAILGLLNEALIWENQKSARSMIRRHYFAPYFGFSSRIAADALQNMLPRKGRLMRCQPFVPVKHANH